MGNKNTGPESWRWRLAKAGKTAREFRKISGVHNSLMSQYMNGKLVPDEDRIKEIEAALKKLGV